jgi:hypothetical protein
MQPDASEIKRRKRAILGLLSLCLPALDVCFFFIQITIGIGDAWQSIRVFFLFVHLNAVLGILLGIASLMRKEKLPILAVLGITGNFLIVVFFHL